MTVATLAFVALAGVHQERTAVKSVLPNGATVYVQKIPDSRTFSIVLSSVPAGEPDTPETHGLRHVLEHLVAKGPKKDVDALVEAEGMVLLAETSRDAVTFQVTGKPGSFATGLTAVRKLLEGFDVTADELKKETGIITEETALRNWDVEAVADGWRKAYGERSVDPFGDAAVFSALTVDQLKAGYARMTAGRSLCVCVFGPMDAEPTAKTVSDWLAKQPAGAAEEPWSRAPSLVPVSAGGSGGVALCVPVPPIPDSLALVTLAAAFGVSAWVPEASILSSPSGRNGMVSLALRSEKTWAEVSTALKGREALVAKSGRQLLQAWIDETAADPARIAKLAGVVLPLRPSFDPMALSALAAGVTTDEVAAEVKRLLAATGAGK